ncbi:EH domain [Trinorchestia longiramus]|nr:EH domain [Trinorchestia longiramus]
MEADPGMGVVGVVHTFERPQQPQHIKLQPRPPHSPDLIQLSDSDSNLPIPAPHDCGYTRIITQEYSAEDNTNDLNKNHKSRSPDRSSYRRPSAHSRKASANVESFTRDDDSEDLEDFEAKPRRRVRSLRRTTSGSSDPCLSSPGSVSSPGSDSATPTNLLPLEDSNERTPSHHRSSHWHRLVNDEHCHLLGTEEDSSDRHSSNEEDRDDEDQLLQNAQEVCEEERSPAASTATLRPDSSSTAGPESSCSSVAHGIPLSNVGGNGGAEAIWRISEEQRNYYTQQFRRLQPDLSKVVQGQQAKHFFEKSKLATDQLTRIWHLSDVTQDGALSLPEFLVAMHLVVARRNNVPLPSALPQPLLALLLPSLQQQQQQHVMAQQQQKDNAIVSSRTRRGSSSSGGSSVVSSVPPPSTAAPSLPPSTGELSDKEIVSPSRAKEWTKFVDSPTSTVSSPGLKPVNFDFQRSAVEEDPQILHPKAVRVTPEPGRGDSECTAAAASEMWRAASSSTTQRPALAGWTVGITQPRSYRDGVGKLHDQRLQYQPQQQQQPQQLQQDGTESGLAKLNSLQAKLQQETDRILRWKAATEVELNQKNRELSDSQHTIEGLRSNLIEAQLSSEKLSNKLLKQKQITQLVESKVATTRGMMDQLEQQQSSLQSIVQQFNACRRDLEQKQSATETALVQIKDSVAKTAAEQRRKLEELQHRSTEAAALAEECVGEAEQQLSERHEELQMCRQQLRTAETQLQLCEQRLSSNEQQLLQLQQQETSLNDTVNKLRGELEETKRSAEGDVEALQQRADSLQRRLDDSQHKLSDAMEDLALAADKIRDQEGIQLSMEEHRHELDDRIEQLEHDIAQIKLSSETNANKAAECEAAAGEASKESARVKAVMVQLQDQLQHSELQLQEMQRTLEAEVAGVSEELEVARSQAQLLHTQEQAGAVRDLEAQLKAAEAVVEQHQQLQQQLHALNEKLEERETASTASVATEQQLREQVACKDDALQLLQLEYGNLHQQHRRRQAALTEQCEVAALKVSSIEELVQQLQQEKERLIADVTRLNSELVEAAAKVNKLQVERDNFETSMKNFTSELNSASEASKLIVKHNEDLLKELNAKTATNRTLEKEAKAHKKTLTAETKKSERLQSSVAKLEKCVEQLKKERQWAEETTATLQQQLLEDQTQYSQYRLRTDETMSQLNREKEEARELIQKAEERAAESAQAADEAARILEDSKSEFDARMKETYGMLSDRRKLYDETMESMTQKMQAAETRAAHLSQLLDEKEKTVQQLQLQLSSTQAAAAATALTTAAELQDTDSRTHSASPCASLRSVRSSTHVSPLMDVVNMPERTDKDPPTTEELSAPTTDKNLVEVGHPAPQPKSPTQHLASHSDLTTHPADSGIFPCTPVKTLKDSYFHFSIYLLLLYSTPLRSKAFQLPSLQTPKAEGTPVPSYSNWRRSILKDQNTSSSGGKRVAFNSPASIYQFDSDSSDVMELNSDLEARFEAMARARSQAGGRTLINFTTHNIPRANVAPLQRPSRNMRTNKKLNSDLEARFEAMARARSRAGGSTLINFTTHNIPRANVAPLQRPSRNMRTNKKARMEVTRTYPSMEDADASQGETSSKFTFVPSRIRTPLGLETRRDNIAELNNSSYEEAVAAFNDSKY